MLTSRAIHILIYIFLFIAQLYCIIRAERSKKAIGRYVARFNMALGMTIISNIIVLVATNMVVASFGYYLYYIGMTLVMVSIVNFTTFYCKGIVTYGKTHMPAAMYIMALVDLVQLHIGIFTKHVFTLETVVIDDSYYFKAVPSIGLTIHRFIDYAMFFCVLLIFWISVKKTSKLYREKYIIALGAFIVDGICQAFFIFNKYQIDKSVMAHCVVGIILYYFAVKYRPLKLLDTLLSRVASNLTDSVFVFDEFGKCIWANDNAYNLLNYRGEISHIKEALFAKFGDLGNRGEEWQTRIKTEDPEEYFTLEKKSVKSEDGLTGSFLVIVNNTEQKKAVDKELYDSCHDKLTGLLNMTALYKEIKEVLSNTETPFCVLYFNVKNFKLINDIFGNRFGDKALIKIAGILKNNFSGDGFLAGRLVGDTFGVFMPVAAFNEKQIIKAFSDITLKSKDTVHKICIHIGVYNIIDTKLDVSAMFDRAHMALLTLTDNYKTSIKIYDESLRKNLLEEQQLSISLPKALEENQIKPYLQPITDATSKVVGAEVLARWIHPELGFLPPGKFIPVFEKNGLISEVDKFIWEKACEILASWKTKYPDFFLSINISPKDFYFTDVVTNIKDLVEQYDIVPAKLRIEITETAMMSDQEEKIKIFNDLRSAGFIVEMDDFGSGYSSLNMLKKMPVDILKIDMNFLSDEEDSSGKSNVIVKNVIRLSQELQMTALTEGVETNQQYSDLIDMGCSLFQGYYFAKPMPLEEFEDFVDNRKI